MALHYLLNLIHRNIYSLLFRLSAKHKHLKAAALEDDFERAASESGGGHQSGFPSSPGGFINGNSLMGSGGGTSGNNSYVK